VLYICVVSKLFHYKDRSSKFFVICALKIFFDCVVVVFCALICLR